MHYLKLFFSFQGVIYLVIDVNSLSFCVNVLLWEEKIRKEWNNFPLSSFFDFVFDKCFTGALQQPKKEMIYKNRVIKIFNTTRRDISF